MVCVGTSYRTISCLNTPEHFYWETVINSGAAPPLGTRTQCEYCRGKNLLFMTWKYSSAVQNASDEWVLKSVWCMINDTITISIFVIYKSGALWLWRIFGSIWANMENINAFSQKCHLWKKEAYYYPSWHKQFSTKPSWSQAWQRGCRCVWRRRVTIPWTGSATPSPGSPAWTTPSSPPCRTQPSPATASPSADTTQTWSSSARWAYNAHLRIC